MSPIYIAAIGVLGSAIGLLITLFGWARARRTLLHAEEQTREHSKDFLTQDIDINLIRGPQERIDAEQAAAVAELVKALEKTEGAVVQIGTVVVVKTGGTLIVRDLNTRELRYLERHQELMRSPEAMLAALNDPNAPFSSGRVTPQPGDTNRR